MKQNFEEIVRNSVNSHEMPYEKGAWETFQKNATPATPLDVTKWFIALAVFVVLGITATYFLNQEQVELKNEPQISSVTSPESNNLKALTNKAKNKPVLLEQEKKTTETQSPKKRKKPERSIPLTLSKADKVEKANKQDNKDEIANPVKNKAHDRAPIKLKAQASFYLPKTICLGETIYLTSDESKISHSYTWRINNELSLNGSIQKYVAQTTGTISISLLVLSEKGEVLAEQTKSIEVKALPEVTIEVTQDEYSILNNQQLEALSKANDNISWDLGDGTKSSERSFSHSYQKSGTYNIICRSTSQFGCEQSASAKIEIPGIYNIRKDYGFSPNGDNINDHFIPVELKDLNVKFSMRIYSKNGQLIYTTNSYLKPWNGILPNGAICSFGSYVWIVTLTNEFGNEEVYKGTVTNVIN